MSRLHSSSDYLRGAAAKAGFVVSGPMNEVQPLPAEYAPYNEPPFFDPFPDWTPGQLAAHRERWYKIIIVGLSAFWLAIALGVWFFA